MLRRVVVGENERVLVTRKRRFADILEPGEYWLFGLGVDLVPYNVRDLAFAGEWADHIANRCPDLVERYFTPVATSDAQVAVVYLDGKLSRVIGPSNRVLFWKAAVNVAFELIDVRAQPEVPAKMLAALAFLATREMPAAEEAPEGEGI